MNEHAANAFDLPLGEATAQLAHPIVIKVHDHGYSSRIIKLNKLPVTLGRSLHCDIIIDHPGISATHARLERDAIGSIIISDAGSKNGLWHAGRRVDQVHVNPNATVQLSEIQIEILTSEELVQTRIDNQPPESPGLTFKKVLLIISSFIFSYSLLTAVYAFQTFLINWPPERPSLLVSDALITWCALSAIAGILSSLNKLHSKRYAGRSLHLIIVGLCAAVLLIDAVKPIINFNVRFIPIKSAIPTILLLVTTAYGLYRILKIMFANWPIRRQILVALATVIIFGIAEKSYRYIEFSSGSRRVWDDQLSVPLIDPTIAAEPTTKLAIYLQESLNTVDQYQQEDWTEILTREDEDNQEDAKKR